MSLSTSTLSDVLGSGNWDPGLAWTGSFQLLDWLREQYRDGGSPGTWHPACFRYDLPGGALSFQAPAAADTELPAAYVSPEETGRIERTPDYRRDFYRLGTVWYALFTGAPPFSGDDPVRVIWQHLAEKPASPRQRNPRLAAAADAVLLKLLAKHPDDRYQSVEGLQHDWEQAWQWQQAGRLTETFTLGENDFPQRFSAPKHLIGRADALQQALHLAEHIAREPQRACLLIAGKALVGKSFFLQKLEDEYCQQEFMLVRSTCHDEDKSPFIALKMAFDRLARQLLTGSDEAIHQLRTDLADVLGDTGEVLIAFAPAWEEIIGPVPPAPALGAQETQNRLAYVLANVLGELAQPGRPFVFLLEDLHLAAPQSLRLLAALLHESQLQHFLLVATLRSDVPETPDLLAWHAQFQSDGRAGEGVLTLATPGSADLEEFLLAARITPEQAAGLAGTLVRKTGGIPFFVDQLLDTAAENGLVTPDRVRRLWRVDLEAISALSITDNMVEFLRDKVLRLPPAIRRFLEAAAVQGLRFDLSKLGAALSLEEDEESVAQTARLLHRLEIIVPSRTAGIYRFSSAELLPLLDELTQPNEKQAFCTKIADHLYQQGAYQQSDQALFELLGYVIQLQPPLPTHYLPLLAEGGRKAEGEGAFDAGWRYYSLLRDSSAPSFEAELPVMQMLVFGLRFQEYAEERARLLTSITPDVLQTAELDRLEGLALMLQQDFPGAVRYTVASLRRLGIRLPLEPSVPAIIFALVRLQQAMRGRTLASIEQLPVTTDRRTQLIVQMLQDTSAAFFLAAPKLLPACTSLQIRLSLQKGLSGTMGGVFAAYGFILSAFNRQFARAEEMMHLAENLNERFRNVAGSAATRFMHNALTAQWQRPMGQNAALLGDNFRYSRDVGALQIAFYSLGTSGLYKMYSGSPLPALLPEFQQHLTACIDKKQGMVADYFRMALQFATDLTGKTFPETIMEGDLFSTIAMEPDFAVRNDLTSQSVLNYFHSLEMAIRQSYADAPARLHRLLQTLPGVGLSSLSLLLAVAVNAYRALHSTTPLPRAEKRSLAAARRHLRTWAKAAPYNFAAWHHLVEGAANRQRRDLRQALFHLEQAILYAQQHQLRYLEALAWEEKAAVLATMLPEATAPTAWAQAYNIYRQWGAVAKCTALEQQHPALLTGLYSPATTTSDGDLSSLLRASNSIAGEIRWESLLEKLTTILVENAGAQTAELLLPREESWYVAARKTGQLPVEFGQAPLSEATHPLAVIRAVRRSLQPVVLANAAQDATYGSDRYLREHRPLSLLCLPVVKNQRLSAIIYLENNLTAGAFTHERLGLVQLLSGQIAISLENAQLYDDMEHRVAERTRQLQAEKEKSDRLLLNILPASIADELRNTGHTSARYYPDATVLFVDIVGFTFLAERTHPEQLVELLDEYFRHFDATMEKHGLEKIKTIGDAYLAVGGLPEGNRATAADVVHAALDIRQFTRQKSAAAAGQPALQVRIGIHSGPVIAGVVGSKKFQFDIWGDTVNTAARMEQSADPDTINISEAIYRQVKDLFHCTARGKMKMKNKGEITAFFVEDHYSQTVQEPERNTII